MSRNATDIIRELRMEPIPQEGAWFALGPRTQQLSSITVLLAGTRDGFSALHRLSIDEGWQWLDGAPAVMLRLRRNGQGAVTMLGPEHRQQLVRRGDWQGAATLGDWTLAACWCSPAFRDEHFELGSRKKLTAAYPTYAAEIAELTRPRKDRS